jgi:hypothetical protein
MFARRSESWERNLHSVSLNLSFREKSIVERLVHIDFPQDKHMG